MINKKCPACWKDIPLPTKTISNPRWNVIKYSAGTEQEEPMYIKREDYTLPTCLAIGGGVFIFCTGLMFWVSKD